MLFSHGAATGRVTRRGFVRARPPKPPDVRTARSAARTAICFLPSRGHSPEYAVVLFQWPCVLLSRSEGSLVLNVQEILRCGSGGQKQTVNKRNSPSKHPILNSQFSI